MLALIPTGKAFTDWYSGEAERLRACSPCPIEVWHHEPRAPLPAGLEPTDDEIEDIVQYQRWRYDSGYVGRTEPTMDHWVDFAFRNFSYYTSALRIAKECRGLTHIVTSGSSRAGQRVILVAAARLGIKASCTEPAIFPRRRRAAMMITRQSAHYGVPAQEFSEWRNHVCDEKRIGEYRDWWLAERRTKHEKSVSEHDIGADELSVVWFQQVTGDAALYRWWVPGDERATIVDDARASGAYVKGHPRARRNGWPSFPDEQVLPARASIHDVFPKCGVAAVISSAVGMEAWMYDLPVAVYGQPFYAQPELVNRSIAEAISSPVVNRAERMRFLDYYIFEYCTLVNDARGALERMLW